MLIHTHSRPGGRWWRLPRHFTADMGMTQFFSFDSTRSQKVIDHIDKCGQNMVSECFYSTQLITHNDTMTFDSNQLTTLFMDL